MPTEPAGTPGDLVSVIIPTFNRRSCLGNTLNSVIAQTHSRWEAVVVDDGSTDGTGEWIVREFGSDPRVRYVYQSNGGVSKARNTAIAHAQGDYVAFLDSDDLWKPWKLEVQLACLRNFPELGMVWTDMEAINPEGAVIDSRHLRTMYSAYRSSPMNTLFQSSVQLQAIAGTAAAPDGKALLHYGDIYPSMIAGNLVHTSTVLLRRERLLQVGGFDETLKYSGEDYDFHLRTCERGPVGLIDLSSIQYQTGQPDQLTQHKRVIAYNFLTTVKRAIAADTTRRFSHKRVNQVLAEANRWIAEEDFRENDGEGVRRHAWSSLRRRPLQPRLLMLFALSCLTASILQPVLRGVRSIKQGFRRS